LGLLVDVETKDVGAGMRAAVATVVLPAAEFGKLIQLAVEVRLDKHIAKRFGLMPLNA
jgi:hypothetical protein